MTIFTAGERDYIALLPMEGAEAEEGEVYLYRYSESEDGQPNLENIEDDDEYEIVADSGPGMRIQKNTFKDNQRQMPCLP